MAKLLMGAIVTKAVGKLNGHCFRINRSTQILQRNPLPPRSRINQNNASMRSIRTVFGYWKNIAPEDKTLWAGFASANPVPDRFGNLKTLTARQYWTKAALPSLRAGLGYPYASVFNPSIPLFAPDSVNVTFSPDRFNIEGLIPWSPGNVEVRIIKIAQPYLKPSPSACKFGMFFNVFAFNPDAAFITMTGNGIPLEPNVYYYVWMRMIPLHGMPSPFVGYLCPSTYA